MSELAIIIFVAAAIIFVLAFTALVMGRKLNFKVDVTWKTAKFEFAASERKERVGKK